MKSSTMKRKLLTMLLVFAVVASYIPFDRAFASGGNAENSRRQEETAKAAESSAQAGGNTSMLKSGKPVAKVKSTRGFPADGSYDIVVLQHEAPPLEKTIINDAGKINTGDKNVWPTLYKYKIPVGTTELNIKSKISYYATDPKGKMEPKSVWYGVSFYSSDLGAGEDPGDKWLSFGSLTNMTLGGFDDNDKIENKAFDRIVRVPENAKYVMVCSNSTVPEVTYRKAKAGRLFLSEIPVAEALQAGKSLGNSKIHLGKVTYNGDEVKGTFSWKNGSLTPQVSDGDTTEYEAKFTPTDKIKYGNGFEFKLKLKVYRGDGGGRFSSFVWHSGGDDLVPEEYMKNRKNIDTVYSIGNIFNSYSSLTNVTAKSAAKIIARNLLTRPEGRRAISIEGYLGYLLGGATLAGDNLVEPKDSKARAVKDAYYKSTGDGTDGYMFFDAPMRDNSLKDKLGIPAGKSGCEVFRDKMDAIFEELNDMGVKPDYVYSDIEHVDNSLNVIRNRHRLELDATTLPTGQSVTAHWNVVWNNARFQREIKPELMKRRFIIKNSNDPLASLRSVSPNPELKGFSYGINPTEEAITSRHNVNAWNVVMKNYTQSLFKRYLINPVKEHFPEAKCSCWDNGNTDSWMNGSYIYESYLGGSTDGGGDSYSCPPIYGQTSDEGILKYNVDNWRNDTVRTAFTSMQHSLRQYRVAVAANGGKVHPFVPNRYFFTETYKYSSFEYFKEFILHVFLQNPDKMISYVNYNDVFAIKNKESLPEGAWPGRHTFANIVLEDLEKISGELDEVAGNGQEVEPLSAHMPQGSDPFVITGLRVGNKNFWRITPDLYKKGVLNSNPAKFMKDFHKGEKTGNDGKKWQEFEIDGKTVKFPEGKIIKPAILASSSAVQYGYWVETKAGVEPKVSVTKKTDGTYENYFRDRTLWEEDFEKFNSGDYLDSHGKKINKPERFRVEAQSGNKFATEISSTNRNLGPTDIPQYSNVIGEWARNQVWEDRVKFNKVPSKIGKGVEVLNMGKTPIEGFGKVLTFRGDGLFYFKDTGKDAEPTMSEKVNGFPAIKANTWYVVRRTIGVDASGRMSTKITAFEEGNESGAKTVSEVATGVFNPDDYVASPIGGPIFFYNFDKDINLRVSVDDCKVYATDFNVKLEVFRKNDGLNLTKIKDTVGHDDDELVLKTTWLNADKKDVGYSVKVEEKGTGVDRTYVLTNGVVPYGENSYSAIKMKKLLPGTKSIRVTASTSDGVVRRIANVAIAPSGEKISKLSSPSSAVPAGYHKVVFNPTSDGKIGTNAQGASVAYKVRNDVSWGEVKGILPATATYKDATKKFKRWSPYIPSDIQLVYDAQYTAEFKNVKAQPELPKVKPLADVGENPGNGYVKAVFDPTVDGKLAGSKVGSVSMGEKLAYALRDDLTWSEVKSELPMGATYKDATKKFAGWQPALQPDSEKVKAATYVAQYTSEPDIIDVTDPSTPTPSGYAKVTFEKGEHGESLEGTSAFFVKKNTEVNLTSRAPKAKAKAGWKFKAWDRSLTVNASSDIAITATYDAMDKVQKLANVNMSAPEGYVKAVFDPTTNGKLIGSKVGSVSIGEKLAYALRKDLAWREVKNELPTGANYKDATKKFTGWSPALQSDGEAVKAATYVAQYAAEPDIIDVTDPSMPTPSGYAKVTFDKGEHGESLEGTSAFFVKKNTEVNLTSRAPKAKAKAGWKFKDWNRSLTVNASSDIAITATYEAMVKVQKLADASTSAPESYVKAVFDPTSNGKLAGSKVGSVSIGEKLAYALRKDLTWGEVKSELPTGATYKDATKKFTGWNPALQSDGDIVKAATYVAQYASESEIVDVTDPSTPTPSGYAKVTFEKGEHGESLEGTSTFFVKKNTSVNLNEKAPVVKAKAGYKFKAWDKALTNFNAGSNEAITITATYEVMVKVIDVTDPSTPTPSGYVKVTFDKGEHGESLEGTSTFFVLKNVQVDLTAKAPKAKAKKGYKFKTWDKGLIITAKTDENITITATYNEMPAIRKLPNAIAGAPEGYEKVVFDPTLDGKLAGAKVGSVSIGEKLAYALRKDLTWGEVKSELPVAATYKDTTKKFTGWSPALQSDSEKVKEATYVAQYAAEPDIIDVTDPSMPTPSGYAKVTFDKGEHGESLEGTSAFFVKKNTEVNLTSRAPKAKAKAGWKFKAWDRSLTVNASSDITITATYEVMVKVQKLDNASTNAPEGYVKAIFDPTSNGKLAGSKVGSVSIGEKLAYALRKDLTWSEVKSELPMAATYKDATKKFTGWSPALQSDSEKVKEATYVAQYVAEPDIIDVTDPSMPTPSGYAKVTFDKGEHGESLEGTSAFFVKKNTEVNLTSRAPKAKAKAGWKFKAWDRSLTVNASSDITITATYEVMVKVIDVTDPTMPTPSGYVKVTFDEGEHGESLEGTSAFFVLKNVQVDLTAKAPKAKAKKGYKFKTWDKGLIITAKTDENITITATYNEMPAIRKLPNEIALAPEGYVKAVFDPTSNGKLAGSKVGSVSMGEKLAYALRDDLTWSEVKDKLPTGATYKDTTKKFTGWSPALQPDSEKVKAATYVAQYAVEPDIIDVTDPSTPTPVGYAKVTFDKGEHGESLEGTSAFFVKKNTEVNLSSRAPKAKAKAGWKFKAWDRSLTVNASSDITITATYEVMVKVQKLADASTNAPEGYVKAIFDPTSDGKLTGNKVGVVSIGEKLAYALRDDLTWSEVKDELPSSATYKDATKKFTGWNPVLQNDSEKVKAATYVAQYESETDVIDVTNPSTPTPAGYAKVTFDKGEHGVAMIGTEVFFVKKNTQVNLSVKAPTVKAKAGYKFKSWDRNLANFNAGSNEAITITATYEVQENIIDVTDPSMPIPEGYVKVTFDKGEHGESLEGTSAFFVLKNVKINLTGRAPKVKAKKGYRFKTWSKGLIFTASSDDEIVITATYNEMPAIRKLPNEIALAPEGYVKAVFDPTSNGKLAGSKVGSVSMGEKLAYALRDDLTWSEVKSELPTGATYKDATKKFTGWNPALQNDSEKVKAATYVAQYESETDVIDVTNPSTPTPAGYAKVTFDKGEHGAAIIGTEVFFVKKNTQVNLSVKAPTVKAKAGYKFKSWDRNLANFNAGSSISITITATYDAMDKVQKLANASTSAPQGYVKAVFDPTSNGKLAGSKVGSVSMGEKLAYALRDDLTWGEVKDELPSSATYKDATKKFTGWQPALQSDSEAVKAATYVAQYATEPDIIDVTDPSTPTPSGYAKATFDKGEHGDSLEGTSTFFVKKNTEVNLSSRAPKAKAKTGWKFKSWDRSLIVNASSDITITAIYEAMVKVQKLADASTSAPEGYVKAVFDPTSDGKLTGNKVGVVSIGEKLAYALRDDLTWSEVKDELPSSATYKDATKKFTGWNPVLQNDSEKVKAATYVAQYATEPDIIDVTDPSTPTPSGYAKVTFDKGEHGESLIGTSTFFVKKSTEVNLTSRVPKAKAKAGWKFKAWDRNLANFNTGSNEAITITATYEAMVKVQKLANASTSAPQGYVKAVFDPTTNGKLIGSKVGSVSMGEKLAYALRDDLTWSEVKSELPVAAIYKDATKKFIGWSPALQPDSETVKTATYVAQYAAEPDIIDVTGPSTPTPSGYAKVTFEKGEHGESLEGTSAFFVKKNTEVNLTSRAPKAKAKTGWKFKSWDRSLIVNASSDITITAIYEAMVKVQKLADANTNAPEGYVKAIFDPTSNGKLAGSKVGSVSMGEKLAYALRKDLTWREVKNELPTGANYKDATKKFTGWSPALQSDGEAVKAATYVAQYAAEPDIIDVTDPSTPTPSGYAKVTFDKGEHGAALIGTETFFVKKNTEIDFEGLAPKVRAKAGYKFKAWNKELKLNVNADVTITAQYTVIQQDEGIADPVAPSIIEDPGTEKPAEGYVRIVFDPTVDGRLDLEKKVSEGKEDNKKIKTTPYALGVKKVYDIKNQILWKHVKNMIAPAVYHKDDSKIFAGWDELFPEDKEKVRSTTYKAQFKKNPGMKIEPGDEPPEKGYSRIVLEPTAEGRFNNRERQQKLTFDVKEDLRWKDVKEQIKCNIANYTVNNPVADKVFDGWDGFDAPNLDNVMIKRILKITEPHEAKYVEKGKEKVEYKVDKNVVNVEYVSIFRKPENVPKDPAIFGKKFVGWQIEGEGRAYTKEEVERIEIIESITFVAKLEDEENAPQNPTPQLPEKSVLPAPTQPRMQQPLAPAPESRKPLIIRKSGIIRLTPKQQQDIVEGKYSYVELIAKKVSLLIMPEQFSKLYKKGNVKTFLKVMTKSKKKVAGKTLMRRIAGEKIFGIRFMVSGKLAKKYSVKPIKIGLPLKGKKLKNRAKVYIMRLSQPRKGAKAAEKFTGQGKLIKGIYDRKSGRVFFKTKQNVTKKYFAVLKKR